VARAAKRDANHHADRSGAMEYCAVMPTTRPSGPHPVAGRADLSWDALVDAYFNAERWKSAVETLSAFHEAKLRHLEVRFGFSLDGIEAPPDHHEDAESVARANDAQTLVNIMRSCLRRSSTLFAPFGTYLEGGPGPLEEKLRRRYDRRFGSKISDLKTTYRRCVADALLMIAPHVRLKRISDDVLEIVGPEPDPDDFW
jgi:hypothetical protein